MKAAAFTGRGSVKAAVVRDVAPHLWGPFRSRPSHHGWSNRGRHRLADLFLAGAFHAASRYDTAAVTRLENSGTLRPEVNR